jgi:hypothetical protein
LQKLAPFPSNLHRNVAFCKKRSVSDNSIVHLPQVPGKAFHADSASREGLAASLAGVWLYGVKTEHQHARETGELELETLINTFKTEAE